MDVQLPDGTVLKGVPDGTTREQIATKLKASGREVPAEWMSGKASAPKPPTGDDDSTFGFVTGNLNKGVAAVAGLPVDTARNAANLGIAAYGTVKGALGGKPPDLIPPGAVGDSTWMERVMRKAVPGSITPAAQPQSTGGRYAAAALQMIPGAFTGRMTPAQVPRAVGAAVTSGIGSEAARDIGGDQWAGVGAMAPGAHRLSAPPGITERAALARKASDFAQAKELGIPVLPKEMKPDKVNLRAEDVVNRELGQPQGSAVTPEAMQKYRDSYAPAYKAAQESPALKNGVVPNAKYKAAIDSIAQEIERNRTKMPETFKGMGPAVQLLREYGYGQKIPRVIPPDVAFRALKKLRSDATKNFQSGDPEKVELARVQRGVAGSLETLVEDNLQADPKAMAAFREARTQIAKSHSVEEALDPATRKLNPAKLSQQWTGGAPFTGDLERLARVSGSFPKSTRAPDAPDTFTHRMSPMTLMHPPAVGAHMATSMLDPLRLSKPYQAAFVDPSRRITPEMEQYIRYLSAAMAANRGAAQ